MSHVTSPHPPTTSDVAQLQWNAFLFILLGRLRLYFSLVEQSLRQEYKYEESTVKDWLSTLDWLEGAFFPIYQLLHRPNLGKDESVLVSNRLTAFKATLSVSRELLSTTEQTPLVRLFDLLSHISRLRRLLLGWQQELSTQLGNRLPDALVALDSAPYGASLAMSARRQLYSNLTEASSQLALNNEDATCMALRRAYFLLYFLAVTNPQAWTAELHDQVLSLHTQALDVFPGGSLAYERIRERQKKLETFDLGALQHLATTIAVVE